MNGKPIELPNGKTILFNSFKRVLLPILILLLVTILSFYLPAEPNALFHELQINSNCSNSLCKKNDKPSSFIPTKNSTRDDLNQSCNIFQGNWIPYSGGPYYTYETKCVIEERQNCMKHGRPDSGFLKWRWKPDECTLPLFDANRFLGLVRGKTLAFVGDSVARNQMQSLMCLLASAAHPVDISDKIDTNFKRWQYVDQNFTIESFWSPLLVKAPDIETQGHSRDSLMNLYLDEADELWTTQLANADIVIISGGQWFFRPYMYYEKGQVVGCHRCEERNITKFLPFYGYRMAFRTAFRALLSLPNGNNKLVFLRTFSPSHFEGGDWNKGGHCARTRPFTRQETTMEWYVTQFHSAQVEEFMTAGEEGKQKGFKFRLLNTTEVMHLRPDGHPNMYGHSADENKILADCVHWCLPGPIDTWNEFLLHMLQTESG